MKRPTEPSNSASLQCASCETQLQPSVVTVANNDGDVFVASIDTWPTHYLDINNRRIEFCGPACVLSWMQKNSYTV